MPMIVRTVAEPMPTIIEKGGVAEIDKQYPLADVDPIGDAWHGIIFGPPGSGKTVMASTFPKPFRWLDADRGLRSVRWAVKRGLSTVTDLQKDLIAYRPVEEANPNGYVKSAAFDKACDMIDHWLSPGQIETWETLVIDSFTEVNEWAINKGLELNAALPTASKPLSGSHKINMQATTRLITGKQDYKSAQGLVIGFLNQFRPQLIAANKNLVVLCHQWVEDESDEDGNHKIIQYQPLLIGQLRARIQKDFDDIWYMQVYNKGTGMEVKVQVHKDPLHECKTRWGDALSREEEADFRKIVEKVRKFHAA